MKPRLHDRLVALGPSRASTHERVLLHGGPMAPPTLVRRAVAEADQLVRGEHPRAAVHGDEPAAP
jgi:hypothetical protein